MKPLTDDYQIRYALDQDMADEVNHATRDMVLTYRERRHYLVINDGEYCQKLAQRLLYTPRDNDFIVSTCHVKPTWQHVLYDHSANDVDELQAMAQRLGYIWYCFNGDIYVTGLPWDAQTSVDWVVGKDSVIMRPEARDW